MEIYFLRNQYMQVFILISRVGYVIDGLQYMEFMEVIFRKKQIIFVKLI